MCCWPGPPMLKIGIALNGGMEPEDSVGREEKGRGAWQYPSSYSPAVSIGTWVNRGLVPVEANGDPECIETNGEPVHVDGDGDTVKTDGDPIGTMKSARAGMSGRKQRRVRQETTLVGQFDGFFCFHPCV